MDERQRGGRGPQGSELRMWSPKSVSSEERGSVRTMGRGDEASDFLKD